jgi:hypothetical protein
VQAWEGHLRRLGHAVDDLLRPGVDVLDAMQRAAVAHAVELGKEGQLRRVHRRIIANVCSHAPEGV